ncbi:MAG: hypothetical protein HY738_09515 [Bacteroidia bacterium]|nr:hypothetical protein [Bacteroidia bacterium]
MKRNILTIKNTENLSPGDFLLYNLYKNIVTNFYHSATDVKTNNYDIDSNIYKKFYNADENIKHYYEAMLGVTSYFQASKGGRGKYIEKKIASISENCCLDISIKELPVLLTNTDILRKKKIFGNEYLSREEKSILRLNEWDYIVDSNETTDLISIINNKLIFLELKNRVDSGGVAARREVLDTKFIKILEYFASDKKIYKVKDDKYSLYEMCKYFGINNITLNMGFLFNVTGEVATIYGDKKLGFYSANKDGFDSILKFAQDSENLEILKIEHESISIKLKKTDFFIDINIVYGNEIPKVLFDKNIDISELLLDKYDDIWLFQLLAIEEITNLIKYGNNIILSIKKIIGSNIKYRKLFDKFINSEGSDIDSLSLICKKVLIEDKFFTAERNKLDYLHDIIYLFCANES